MKLRSRILLVSAAVALPQLLGLIWWDADSRRDAAAATLSSMLERSVGEPGAQARCLSDPVGWAQGGPKEQLQGGPGDEPPPRAAPLKGLARPEIQVMPVGSAGDLELRGGVIVVAPAPIWQAHIQVWLATGWEAPCSLVRIRGNTVPGFVGSVLPASPVWLLPPLVLLGVLWFAVGPPVRRIQRLTQAAREGADTIPVDGDDELGELARALETRTRQLNAQVAQTREREQALRDFVANTAHDVRIPLTVMLGYLSELEPKDPEVVGRALSEAHYLGDLLSNLASHTRLQAHSPFSEVDMEGLILRVVQRHQPLARRRGIRIHWGMSAHEVKVFGELTLLEQALSNLVYNAVRYNREGGNVAVTLEEAPRGGHLLQVEDDGPGVPAEELSRLTQRGFRGGKDEADPGGGSQGLGLSIVAQVAELHGWTLELGLAPAGGLLAVLRIPGS